MADKKISQLTSATVPLAGTEVLPVVQNSSTVKTTVNSVTSGLNITPATVVTTGNIGAGVPSPAYKLHVAQYAALGTQAGAGFGAAISFIPSNSQTNWLIGSNYNVSGVFEITPSTAGGGSSFTTPAMRVASSGDVTAKGNFVVGTSGKGIDFSATPGTGTSELLDDYEEGTWTPTLNVGTVTATNCTYTKIGNIVKLSGDLSAFTDMTDSSEVQISGIPFTSASTNIDPGACYYRYVTTSAQQLAPYIGASETKVLFYASNETGTWSTLRYSWFNNASNRIRFSLLYQAA